MKSRRCKYCRKMVKPSGMPAHVHFRHRGMVLAEFCMSPAMIAYGLYMNGRVPSMQLALPAPNPLTIYSTRPLGRMAAPIPEHRRPKGYTLGYGYSRPADALRGQLRFNRPIY